jgi:metal transporter CNNM
MEALPIFFNKVVPPALAVLISVLFIVFAGEIIP